MAKGKVTTIRLQPDDEKKVHYVQTQLEKSTGLSYSVTDALIAGLRELERKLKSREKHEKTIINPESK